MRFPRAVFLILGVTLLSIAAHTAPSSSSSTIYLKGGPGSVTINGTPAPPGTFVGVGWGPEPQEIFAGTHTRADGSWSFDIRSDWGPVHLYVDGFRVPGGPWDESVPGVVHEIRLDVGVDTDPWPIALYFHVNRDDITVFGEPVHDDTAICKYVNGQQRSCQGIDPSGVVSLITKTGLRGFTFSVNGFPVEGPSYDALPELAPFWITLHAGDPERPPYEFYGLPGDIDRGIGQCEFPDDIIVGAFKEYHWLASTIASADGSWSLKIPSGTTGIWIYAARNWFDYERYIPPDSTPYEATPFGGRQQVELNYHAPDWYILPTIETPAMHDESAVSSEFHRSTEPPAVLNLGLVIRKLYGTLGCTWMLSPQGRTDRTSWFDCDAVLQYYPRPAPVDLHPRLESNVYLTPCSSRLSVQRPVQTTAGFAFLFGRMAAAAPMPQYWLGLENLLVRHILIDYQVLYPRPRPAISTSG